jgi:fumarylacetoacetase
MALGKAYWTATRKVLTHLLSADTPDLRDNQQLRTSVLVRLSEATMHLPARIGDYTDFYASKEHATNVGTMFRGKENALMPNWLHIPIGYHGRASSIIPSGAGIIRPHGQICPVKGEPPIFSASRRLDVELEMAFLVGTGNELGKPIGIEKAEDSIFGVVLMNDWSGKQGLLSTETLDSRIV